MLPRSFLSYVSCGTYIWRPPSITRTHLHRSQGPHILPSRPTGSTAIPFFSYNSSDRYSILRCPRSLPHPSIEYVAHILVPTRRIVPPVHRSLRPNAPSLLTGIMFWDSSRQLRGRSAGTSSSLQRYPAPTGFTSSQSITLYDKSIECMRCTWRPSSTGRHPGPLVHPPLLASPVVHSSPLLLVT